jgi:hypothetical protein
MSILRPQIFALLSASAVGIACAVATDDDAEFRGGEPVCEDLTNPIWAGKSIDAGQVTVENTNDTLVVSASSNAAAGWHFAEAHLFVGTGPVPVNNAGNPAPGQFPYITEFTAPYPSEYAIAIPLGDLNAACGDTITVAFHTALKKLDDDGNPIGEETGWGSGTLIGKNWATSFQYTICCDDEEENQDCTYTQGYWGNHYAGAPNPSQNMAWPIPETTELCGETWLDILQLAPDGGNAWLIVAHQYIGAKLNWLNGASLPQDVADAMWDANAFLNANCDDMFVPANESPDAILTAGTLDAYNNGILGPGHCE